MKKQIYIYENIEQLLCEYDSLPPSAVIDLRQQSKPYLHILPIGELERISACRHWGVVGLIQPDPDLPDDFMPKLPEEFPAPRRSR